MPAYIASKRKATKDLKRILSVKPAEVLTVEEIVQANGEIHRAMTKNAALNIIRTWTHHNLVKTIYGKSKPSGKLCILSMQLTDEGRTILQELVPGEQKNTLRTEQTDKQDTAFSEIDKGERDKKLIGRKVISTTFRGYPEECTIVLYNGFLAIENLKGEITGLTERDKLLPSDQPQNSETLSS